MKRMLIFLKLNIIMEAQGLKILGLVFVVILLASIVKTLPSLI